MIANREEYDPLRNTLQTTEKELELPRPIEKHLFCGKNRSLATAVSLLRNNQVMAVPTDTVYGFAALAQNNDAINSLYKIKKRNENKPLAICVSNVSDVKKWGVVDDLPDNLLNDLLPGPVTIVLKRTSNLNSSLNPGMTCVGIRVPNNKFIKQVVDLIGEPLALTSANESNKPSSLEPEEFSNLWSQLGAIFYDVPALDKPNASRAGSTVVDLSQAGKYKVLRDGVAMKQTVRFLKFYGFIEHDT